MPYFVAVYDVNQKRVGKMLKLFRRYLTWIQNSVFEGELTPAQFKSLQTEADQLMQEGDGVVFYQLRDERYMDRIALGKEKAEKSRFL
ncbi:CRISPR-associated endonuclease Cas2 [Persicitalea jodogahamensis]|uniref:CRISPR-associated endoribonuclease Cas2 n=1 Tax=Persicitalea jodogahamensis TaxID=402147 RepID=A0A8J3D131_9BACT|nr:CRISPR-associated endonuclease Cas2 [Persicitalea jodogahamensis]GHB54358.1 CRISPR-associated endoribonuclease Cas2 [Persicitalea jodogahamensis]